MQERRERLKKEGKLLTKVEKEKKMKTEAQLEALRKQGRKICKRNKFYVDVQEEE